MRSICALLLIASSIANVFADEPKIKNIVFIISDDLKASVLGCYGDPQCETPHIDALAARGMLFRNAYCQGTWCAPSRQSLMFSRYEGKADVNLGQHFRDNGHYSARVGKIYHMRVPGDIIDGTDGLDVPSSWTERFNSSGLEAHTPGDYACLNQNIFTTSLENRESTKMKHRMFVTVEYDGDGSDQPDHKSATKAIELIDTHKDDPFFLAVGFVRPHYPLVAPRQYFAPYPWQGIQLPEFIENDLDDIPKRGIANTVSTTNPIGKYPDNQKRMWSGYYASVAFMDEQVGRVVAAIDNAGLRDNTAIVFTSDHGYHLGEHGFWQKSNLHEEVIRVPLVIAAPGFKTGDTDAIVELMDIFPTVSQLAGLPIPKSVQGQSLVPVLADPQASVRKAALSLNKGHSLRTADWHYIRYNDGSSELYDMDADPKQFTNLAQNPNFQFKRKQLGRQLDSVLSSNGLKPGDKPSDKRSEARK